MTIKLIVGLSNPGKKYLYTRHNIGAYYVYLLAKIHKKKFKKNNYLGYFTKIKLNNHFIYLLIPNIFMNLNGKSISLFSSKYYIKSNEILIIQDELNIPVGKTKLKIGGGHNGHNGIKNIIYYFNKNDFSRLRIGIGHPGNKNKVIDFVLSKPTAIEMKFINAIMNKLLKYTDCIVQDVIKSMNFINSKKF